MNISQLIQQAAAEGNLEVVRWLANQLDTTPVAPAPQATVVLPPFPPNPVVQDVPVVKRKYNKVPCFDEREKKREYVRNWMKKQRDAGHIHVRQDDGKYVYAPISDTVWIRSSQWKGIWKRVLRSSKEFAKYIEHHGAFFPGDHKNPRNSAQPTYQQEILQCI